MATTCTCPELKPFALTYLCPDCGKAHTVYLQKTDIGEQSFADLLRQIKQGILPADYVSENADLSENKRRMIAEITVCNHENRTAYTCVNGEPRERCTDCGRVWADPAQFILTHETEADNGS